MKRLTALFLSISAVVLVAQTGRGRLTDAEVNAAIQAGQGKKLPPDLVWTCVAIVGFGDTFKAPTSGGVRQTGNFDVTVTTEKGQIASLAADAKRLYKPFSITNVTPQMRLPAVYVRANAQKPETSGSALEVAPPAEQIVIKSKVDPSIVIRPAKFTPEPVEWTNMLGGKVHGANGLAVFPTDAIKKLPAGDFDIAVIAAAGERRCKMGVKDRTRLFGG